MGLTLTMQKNCFVYFNENCLKMITKLFISLEKLFLFPKYLFLWVDFIWLDFCNTHSARYLTKQMEPDN